MVNHSNMKLRPGLLFALGFALIILLTMFMTCDKCNKPAAPSHKEEKNEIDKEKKKMVTDLHLADAVLDSIERILQRKTDSINRLKTDRAALIAQIDFLRKQSRAVIDKVQDDDTTGYYDDCQDMADHFNEYIQLTVEEQKKADSIIQKLTEKLSLGDSVSAIKQRLIDELQKAYFNCTVKYEGLYKDYNKWKPRNQVYIGLGGMGNANQPLYIGASALLHTKKDMIYEAGIWYGNNSKVMYWGGMKFLLTFHKRK